MQSTFENKDFFVLLRTGYKESVFVFYFSNNIIVIVLLKLHSWRNFYLKSRLYLFSCQISVDHHFQLIRESSGPLDSRVVILWGLQNGVEGHEVAGSNGVFGNLKTIRIKCLNV